MEFSCLYKSHKGRQSCSTNTLSQSSSPETGCCEWLCFQEKAVSKDLGCADAGLAAVSVEKNHHVEGGPHHNCHGDEIVNNDEDIK